MEQVVYKIVEIIVFIFQSIQEQVWHHHEFAGVLALLAESNPNITQSEANDWLNKNGTDDIMYDTGTDDCTDFESLQGAANKILRWINQRPETGNSFPKINAKARPNSGRSWPRPRIRVRG